MKDELELTLDQYFPKIGEDNKAEKALNKRGAALVLFSQALILADAAIRQSRLDLLEAMMHDCDATENEAGRVLVNKWKMQNEKISLCPHRGKCDKIK